MDAGRKERKPRNVNRGLWVGLVAILRVVVETILIVSREAIVSTQLVLGHHLCLSQNQSGQPGAAYSKWILASKAHIAEVVGVGALCLVAMTLRSWNLKSGGREAST